jgi:hypothetical protein
LYGYPYEFPSKSHRNIFGTIMEEACRQFKMQGFTITARVMKRRGCDVPREGFQLGFGAE